MRSFATSLLALFVLVGAEGLSAQLQISARGADIRFGGRIHYQYAASSVDGATSTFFFRRARVTADARINDFLDGRLQTELVTGGPNVLDAWIRFTLSPGFRIQFGQFKRVYDLFEVESSNDLSIIERDGRIAGVDTCSGVGRVCSYGRLTSANRYSVRDQGIRVQAGSGKVRFFGTLTNGSGTNTADSNDAKSFNGRVEFAASDDLSLGGGLAFQDYDLNDDTEYASAWGIDLNWGTFRDGLHLMAAIAGGDNWRASPDATFMAWQVMGSWYAPLEGERIVGIEPLLRVSAGDPDTDVDSDAGTIYTPGLMFHLGGRNKFGVNLDVWSPEEGDTEYGLKTQFFLYF